MTSRYYNREILSNFSSKYSQILKQRNVTFIDQYDSPSFYKISAEDYEDVVLVSHVWSLGDRLYKLADEFYSDPTLWWIIAWFNRFPTESHIKIGWVVDIPLPLDKILELWDKRNA